MQSQPMESEDTRKLVQEIGDNASLEGFASWQVNGIKVSRSPLPQVMHPYKPYYVLS